MLLPLVSMHFSWEKHLKLSQLVAGAADKDRGLALALMGVGLTLLSKDLLSIEQGIAASGQGGCDSARTPRHSA